MKSFAEYVLDSAERVLMPTPIDALHLPHEERTKDIARELVLQTYCRRPELLKERKRLFEWAKDVTNLIMSGAIPKPAWWDQFQLPA